MSINQVESVFQIVQKEERNKSLNLQFGHDTDIGGDKRKPNQDRKI
jgi:hypothetical protein